MLRPLPRSLSRSAHPPYRKPWCEVAKEVWTMHQRSIVDASRYHAHRSKVPAANLACMKDRMAKPKGTLKARVYTIIFKSDTRAGREFDLWLLLAILISAMLVMLDSLPEIHARW